MQNPIIKKRRLGTIAALLFAAAASAGIISQSAAAEKTPARFSGPKFAQALKTLRSVEPNGVDNAAAAQAWGDVAAAGAAQLPTVLAAIDEAGPLGANWLSAAVQTIADRQLKQGDKLPAAELEAFVLDKQHAPRGRRLAFEWLVRADNTAADRLTPGFLFDPSPELRRDAVARLIAEGDKLVKPRTKGVHKGVGRDDRGPQESPEVAQKVYDKALSGAVDLDQVKKLKTELEKLGEKVDLPLHFGFVTRWKVIGPFDNTGEKGFDVVYPPEKAIELDAEYEGKPLEGKARQVKWIDFETQDDYGIVDLNAAVGKANGVAAYAWAEFNSPSEQPAELRLGRDNANKMWLNGKVIHEQRVYHSGADMDQFIGRGQLRKGKNTILVKVLQNEQKEEWAQTWGFQLRVCDATGVAIKPQTAAENSPSNVKK
ncbi:MAG TPA: hypothetical protein VMV10_13350 [Pirellulales bacterium]|nr:hypothetical protein [Pirellulales bacterium]